ncbi:MAG: prolyl aminopeptidase, partial [Candidatus Hydrogenedentes bacterium]|nr:prolyl aminopeptidase [Candidatus Hydrogenedentota bacterium]
KNNVFSKENSLTNKIEGLRSIPTTIIQGRYDIICPIKTAHKIHQLWSEADYIIVPDAGHSALDASLRSRLIEATQSAKTIK